MHRANNLAQFWRLKMEVDYLIVGQGLAGSSVAVQAVRRGMDVCVIDEPEKNFSSRIAAGLFNPVTGQNSVKTWMSSHLFPYLHTFYREAEELVRRRFFYPRSLYRPFGSIQEQNEWMGKSADEHYADFLQEIRTKPLEGNLVVDPFGGMMLSQGGFVNMDAFLGGIREWLIEKGQFLSEHFAESEVEILPDGIRYRNIKARYLVLCQGIAGRNTQRFKPLPLRALKGETLIVKTSWDKDVILNRGVYMVPVIGSDRFRVGATYVYNDDSVVVTEKGRAELCNKLAELLSLSFEVVGQEAGVRPTMVDRKPILGHDPDSDRVIIFNGLGTKGVSLAPYFSDVLIRWTEERVPLAKDIALARFK